jgi:hypothetical protein
MAQHEVQASTQATLDATTMPVRPQHYQGRHRARWNGVTVADLLRPVSK